jgi:kynurenine formamidase
MDFADKRLIDLSVGLEAGAASEPFPPSIDSMDHEEGGAQLAANLQALGHDVEVEEFPDGQGLAWEQVSAITHAGTHLDAPWHYGPDCGGEPSKTIDEIPLEWCCGNAVILDVRDLDAGEEITPEVIDDRLDDLDHELSAGELVFLETGADDRWGDPDYLTEFPGMGAAATKHLVERGVKVIGTDAYGFDKPFDEMGRRPAEPCEAGLG